MRSRPRRLRRCQSEPGPAGIRGLGPGGGSIRSGRAASLCIGILLKGNFEIGSVSPVSEHEKKHRIGRGLPRCIGEEEDGFDILKNILGLNAKQCTALVKSDFSKEHAGDLLNDLKNRKSIHTSERNKLVLFELYGNPNIRRELWSHWYEDQVRSDGSDTKIGSDFPARITIPSLEFCIFVSFVQGSSSSEDDVMGVDRSFAEWPDLIQHLKEDVPWGSLVARAWSDVQKYLDRWDEIDDEQRRQATLIVFSVATIVNDKRVLEAAIEKAPSLKTEFADILSDSSDSNIADDAVKETSVAHQWGEFCNSLEMLARKAAGPPPTIDSLSEINLVVKKMKEIKPAMQQHLVGCSFEGLMSYLGRHINVLVDVLEADQNFSYLGKGISAYLHGKWQNIQKSLSPETIRKELQRLKEEVPGVAKDVRTLSASLQSAVHQLDSLSQQEPPSEDLTLRYAWEAQREVQRDEQNKRCSLLKREWREKLEILISRLSPFGAKFEPGKNDSAGTPGIKHTEIESHDVPKTVLGNSAPAVSKPPPADKSRSSSDKDESKPGELEELALKQMAEALLEKPRPQIAYTVQVGQLLDRLDLTTNRPPVVLFKAALLSDYLCFPDKDIATELANVFEHFPSPEQFVDDANRDLYVMLVFAGALLPALLAPHSGALAILSGPIRPSQKLSSVYDFVGAIKEKGLKLRGAKLDSAVLAEASSDADWEDRRSQLKSEVEKWIKEAKTKTVLFAPATTVWQRWVAKKGLINNLIVAIQKNVDTEIYGMIDKLENRDAFDKLVSSTDRKTNKRVRGVKIHANALATLYAYAQEAVDFGYRYLRLSDSKRAQSDFLSDTLKALRETIDKMAPPALEDLSAIANEDRTLKAGVANTARYALERFCQFFSSEHRGSDREICPIEILASGLFRFPTLRIAENGIPEGDVRDVLNTLLLKRQERFEAAAAFAGWLKKDIGTAQRVFDWLISEDRDNNYEGMLKPKLEKAIDSETSDLRSNVDEMRLSVEVALVYGHISDAQRSDYDAELVEIERYLEGKQVSYFNRAKKKLREIEHEMDKALDVKRKEVKKDLDQLGCSSDSKEYKAIVQSIEQGDILTANESISRARNKEPFHPRRQPSERNIFDEFYPSHSRTIRDYLNKFPNPESLMKQIMDKNQFAGMDLTGMQPAKRQSAKDMLKAWFSLKRDGDIESSVTQENIKAFFVELGFIVQKIEIERVGPKQRFAEAYIYTDPLHARERCPVPKFGWDAEGKYRLVFLWGDSTEEGILQHVGDNSAATIILYFGCLTEERREIFARITRERRETMLLLDELLVIFLCGERDLRMPALFACALPFTYVQPYILTSSGQVPPEMFYGRDAEIQGIADLRGAAFIYGGRQLGKTAILREVKRRVHQPEKGEYALWIDLKGHGIGHGRDPEEIWSVICQEVGRELGAPDDFGDPNLRTRNQISDFIECLCSRFGKSTRKVLRLLLDEADNFLEVDARDTDKDKPGSRYRESVLLKSLMDKTDCSIKVVFAGLHNVLRTAEGANHPLGHFGKAISVGPLLSGHNWQAAEALIVQPLIASGYRFEQRSLVTRILAQTNCYPGLIQLYGSSLIDSMCSRINGAPLYRIDDRMLDGIYQNTDLSQAIRNKFDMTLELDPRYEVIAYSIAYKCVKEENLLRDGISHRDIDDDVRCWWAQGFEDIEPYMDNFRALLDEMVGLGVLRKAGNTRYTLRNPNILLLMGAAEDIENKLLKERTPEPIFEREIFRARDPQNADGPSRSPLTFKQEDVLRAQRNGVSLVCGLPASGFGTVVEFLKSHGQRRSFLDLGLLIDVQAFEKEFRKAWKNRNINGTTIYLVGSDVPWSEKWVEVALQLVQRLQAVDRYAQIMFMAEPEHLWRLLPELQQLTQKGIQWISLRPWRESFIRQWMIDVGFGRSLDIQQKIVEQTGGWWVLLKQLHGLNKQGRDLEGSLETLRNNFAAQTAENAAQTAENIEQQLLDHFGFGGDAPFGYDGPRVQDALRILADYGDAITFEEFRELADEDIDTDTLKRSLEWAELLYLVRRAGQDMWQMDPIVASVLKLSVRRLNPLP